MAIEVLMSKLSQMLKWLYIILHLCNIVALSNLDSGYFEQSDRYACSPYAYID